MWCSAQSLPASNTLQHTATYCNILQHIHICNTLQQCKCSLNVPLSYFQFCLAFANRAPYAPRHESSCRHDHWHQWAYRCYDAKMLQDHLCDFGCAVSVIPFQAYLVEYVFSNNVAWLRLRPVYVVSGEASKCIIVVVLKPSALATPALLNKARVWEIACAAQMKNDHSNCARVA